MNKIAHRPDLRKLRTERELSLDEAAAEVGCHPVTLSRIERGTQPTIDVALGIERVFGIKVAAWGKRGSKDEVDRETAAQAIARRKAGGAA